MSEISKLFKDKGYIEGITIINVEGEILFSAKFNKKMNDSGIGYEVVGKNFLDIYEGLDENNSSTYRAMRTGTPIYIENQLLKSVGQNPIHISSLSVPIKSGGKTVGAIDLSVTEDEQKTSEMVEFESEILYSQNNVKNLHRADDKAIYNLDDILTCDAGMIEMKENIYKFAQTELPIMIYGETGTGKELVAHSIHQCSKRAAKPFVVQNCASIPANLIESILFGTSKGAFTGALDNVGLLELANGGTLFLDEINSMPMEMQAKILRVVQDGTFRRIGDKKQRHVDVRILSSTNEKAKTIIDEGRFRKDLFYRLAVLKLEIPNLSERKRDIPLLTQAFINKYNAMFRKNIHKVSKSVTDLFLEYSWPGNVRELDSVIASAVCMAGANENCLELEHIPEYLQVAEMDEQYADVENAGSLGIAGIGSMALPDAIIEFEKAQIEKALKIANHNISKAAELLHVPRQTLSRKVKDYQL